jgi:ABC-type multidrug transport system ATPase subunit
LTNFFCLGFTIEPESDIQYQGIPKELMHNDFRGEVIYNAETDVHFPHLTVGQTLLFAAKARVPRIRIGNVSREKYAEHLRDLVMAIFNLSHTINTKVGNDFVRGISGGERKRVSISETILSGTSRLVTSPFLRPCLSSSRLAAAVLGQQYPRAG